MTTTTIVLNYRPLAGIITLWTDLADLLPEDAPIEKHGSEGEGWQFGWETYEGQFIGALILDIHGMGRGWEAMLSLLIPDDVVVRICDLVAEWDGEYHEMVRDGVDVRTRSLHYRRQEFPAVI